MPQDVQHEAAARYGYSFGQVRIHTGARASDVARSLNAAAFTLGNDIVFGADRYAPASPGGRLLLHHELKHVAQQRSARRVETPELDSSRSGHEADARHIFDPHVQPLSIQKIQCAPADEPYTIGTVADKVGRSAFGDASWPFLKALFEGFMGALQADVKSGRADAAKNHLAALFVPWNAIKFHGGFLLGFVIGLVSPITDLIKGIVGAVRLAISAIEWLAKWSPVGIAVSAERQQKIVTLLEKFSEMGTQLNQTLADFIADPKGAIQKFSGFLDNLMQLAVGKAREFGGSAAHSLFDYLQKDFFEMGQGIGEVCGAVVAQVLLLVFSDAIGNLISKGASFLGKAAEFVAGKAVEVFEWFKGFASEILAMLRNAVKGALKLFEGLVNKAVELFEAAKAIFTESEMLGAEGRVAAGVGRDVAHPATNVMESRMVSSTRTAPAKVSDLRPPKVHPSNVAVEAPKAPKTAASPATPRATPYKRAPFDEPLTPSERGLSLEELKQKHLAEEMAEFQSSVSDVTGKEVETGPRMQEATKTRAGLAKKPQHHVFPQQFRTWFEDHGFTGKWDIDRFTVMLDESEHVAIHGGGNYKLGRTTGFEWNMRVKNVLDAEEAKLGGGRLLSRTRIKQIVEELMKEYQIPKKYIPY
ncbi:eCIS core domain-containing protein [Paraburkholderia sp. 35.1]|uniref:eCIS core domain-containing protein n=1 Tax=Paraburkholderia sp. 35.1 TaxID=2991058 RepID=UPI003D1ECE6F